MPKKLCKKVTFILCLLLLIIAASGCGTDRPAGHGTPGENRAKEIHVTDFRGKELVLPAPATRIACMLDSALTTLHMLGLKDEVVALDKWTYDNDGFKLTAQIDARIARKELPAVTGNLEQLLASKPELVIIWSGHEDIKQIEEHGLKVYGVQINTFEDVYKMVSDLGLITGREQRAAELIAYTKNEMQAVGEKVANLQSQARAMFVWGPSLLDIAGSKSTGNDILVMAGADNVAKSINEEHIVANMEQVVQWNPDTIIMWNSKTISPDTYLADPQWKTIKAVQEKKIYMLPNFFYCDLWTLKFQYAIKASAAWLYPEAFAGLELDAARKKMIETLYGGELSE